MAMYLHFYGNGLGQTWPWSSVVRGTRGQVLSSWSEAAAAAICRGWDGTRGQTPKLSRPAMDRNQEPMRFSLRRSSKSCDSLLPCALADGLPLHLPPPKGQCNGKENADSRERRWRDGKRSGSWERRRKVFHVSSVDQVGLIPVI